MKTRDEMEESRKKRQTVSGGTIWHNAIKPIDSSDVIYNWERFEDYSVMKPLPLDPKGPLSMSLEGNEIHVPDKEPSTTDNAGLLLPTLSSDGNSVGFWSSAASTGMSLHVPSESIGNESLWGTINNGAPSKFGNGATNESLTLSPNGLANEAASIMNGAANGPTNTASTSVSSGSMNGTATMISGGTTNGAATLISGATGETSNPANGPVSGPVSETLNAPSSASIPSGSASGPGSNNGQSKVNSQISSSTELNSVPTSFVSLSSPADRSNAPASIPVNAGAPHLTISTTNLSPAPNASGTLSCGSPSSSAASAMSPTIRPILASPRLNMPGSSLISPPQIRKKSVSTSAFISGHSKTLSDNVSTVRHFPISASLSLNSPLPSQSVKLSVPTSASPLSRQDSSRLFSGQIRIPIVQSQSPNPVLPSSGDHWPLPTENVSGRMNQGTSHKSSASSDDSFFPERTHSEKDSFVPNSISVDENMMPVLDSPISQSTQNNHPALYATLSASSTYSRSKRMLTRTPEVMSSQPEEAVLGIPKDSRSDNSRVSIFMNDVDPKAPNKDSDFMDELDQNLPADFQKEFISEAESMTGLQCTFCFRHKLRLVNTPNCLCMYVCVTLNRYVYVYTYIYR